MNRPLNGEKILLTRPQHQAENLARLIAEHGGQPVLLPALAIAPVADSAQVAQVLASVDGYQWLIFVSANAVNFSMPLHASKLVAPSPAVAAIGQATAAALCHFGIAVDLLSPPPFTSESLLATPPMQRLERKKILIVRGQGGREYLAEALTRRGATVAYLEVYRRCVPQVDCTEARSLLAQGQLAAITVTCGAALENLSTLLGSTYQQKLWAVPLVVISLRLAKIAQELGFKRVTVARQATDAALAEAVIMTMTGGQGDRND